MAVTRRSKQGSTEVPAEKIKDFHGVNGTNRETQFGGGSSSLFLFIRVGSTDNTIKKIKFTNGIKNRTAKKVGVPMARRRLTVSSIPKYMKGRAVRDSISAKFFLSCKSISGIMYW